MYQIIDSDVIFKQCIVEQHHTRLKINLTAIELQCNIMVYRKANLFTKQITHPNIRYCVILASFINFLDLKIYNRM